MYVLHSDLQLIDEAFGPGKEGALHMAGAITWRIRSKTESDQMDQG